MPPEIQKIAESYVKDQLAQIGGKPTKQQVAAAVQKVAKAISEVRIAVATTHRRTASR